MNEITPPSVADLLGQGPPEVNRGSRAGRPIDLYSRLFLFFWADVDLSPLNFGILFNF
jgi:hypothetical protein